MLNPIHSLTPSNVHICVTLGTVSAYGMPFSSLKQPLLGIWGHSYLVML